MTFLEQPRRALPAPLAAWFAGRGWSPRPHQLAVLAQARAGHSVLLVAPTGGGKTMAGFLPALSDLVENPRKPKARRGLHTLYLSPLKALAVDIARNLESPVREAALPVTLETRTGDTPPGKRARQVGAPPDILLTTPEQLALLLAGRQAHELLGSLRYVIVDEIHAFENTKRGDLLALGLARLAAFSPGLVRIGLSATVDEPERLARYRGGGAPVAQVRGAPGAPPDVGILSSSERIPWAGHSGQHALAEVYAAIERSRMALIFVNTRSQAEAIFQTLWRINEKGLPIALHHGSLDREQRRKVEAAMSAGKLRAVVCTSTLDLGIDWGDVDMVIQMGAPKGISRTLQRIGRANHRMDEPSRAVLVPANRFEMLECRAAIQAIAENVLDGTEPRPGALDVLAQHILGCACHAPFDADALFAEVTAAAPYAALTRETFDRVLEFVATGGYVLNKYERFHKLRQRADRTWGVAHPMIARQYRLNVGTIVEAAMLKVRLKRGRTLGEIEEYFIEQLAPGDTFLFAGQVLRFERLHEMAAEVTPSKSDEAKVPAYMGGKFPLSTFLAARVRRLLASPRDWKALPEQVQEWLRLQQWRSILPKTDEMLVETFPRGRKHYMVAYPFEGRLAHQTLGMLVTRRMERAGLKPLGFVASEYALAIWSLNAPEDINGLFHEDLLGDDLDAWLAETPLLKRTFKNVAIISGLIERRHPGLEKNGRQVTFSTDLIYDVLRQHEPDHILLRATWADAAGGLLDVRRLAERLKAVQGRIVHKTLDRVSPLAVPVLLDIGKESVPGGYVDDLLGEAAAEALIEEASRLI
jgi:ATP-dependent Lhr-like helicase